MSNFKKSFKVDGKPIGDGYPASIIAEAGVNHFGDLKKAYQLIDLACEAKADFFKIQHYKTENLVGSIAPEWIERLKEKELTDIQIYEKYHLMKEINDNQLKGCWFQSTENKLNDLTGLTIFNKIKTELINLIREKEQLLELIKES